MHTFYKLYNSIKNNDNNFIYYYENNNYKNKKKKSFSDFCDDVLLVYNNFICLNITHNDIVALFCDNDYKFLVLDMALILTGAQTIVQSSKESMTLAKSRLTQFKASVIIGKNLKNFNDFVDVKKYSLSEMFVSNDKKLNISHTDISDMDFSIVFSSGTSGKPKGLGVSESGILDTGLKYFSHMKYNSSDKMLIFLPLASLQQRFLSWSCFEKNIDIILIDDITVFKGIIDFKPSIILAPPNFYYNLYRENIKVNFLKKFLRKIIPYKSNSKFLMNVSSFFTYRELYKNFGYRPRYLLTGMAPIDMKVLEFFRDAYLDIYQIYGQTEIGMICGNTVSFNKIGTVGKPMSEMYISDEGEIVVVYPFFPINNYYLDNDKIVKLPNDKRTSGDVGNIDEDGFVTILGRVNETIILNNGMKLNPAIIENKIKAEHNLEEILIFKANNNTSLNILDIAIICFRNSVEEMSKVKDSIESMKEIKFNSENIRISIIQLTEKEKKKIYTENNKLSRVRAIELLKSKIC